MKTGLKSSDLTSSLRNYKKKPKEKNLRADFSETEKQLRKSVKSKDSAMKFLVHVHAFLFDTLMIISGIARGSDVHMFSINRCFPSSFPQCCATSHSYPQCMNVPIAPHPCSCLVLIVLFTVFLPFSL